MRYTLLLLAACGGVPVCESSLGPVYSDVAVNCEAFEQRIALVPPYLKSEHAFTIYETQVFPCQVDTCFGRYSTLTGEVELGNDAEALVHELLHAFDARLGVVRIPDHAGWESNGYYALTNEYRPHALGHPVTE